MTAQAVVQTAPQTFELQEFELPPIGDDEALVQVEACGICGTDTETFSGASPLRYPVIPGHEPVGRIAAIGSRAASRWRLTVGDRVVMQSEFGCGRCLGCMDRRACLVAPGTHGFMPTTAPPALWGGYAEYLYVAPGSVPHRIAPHVSARIAALYNPLGAGFAWAVTAPDLRVGDTVAVFGPGQRGLACVIAARAAGAARIFVTGCGARDAHKLALAAEFGAELAVDIEQHEAIERIMGATGGLGVDIAIDTTPHATQPVRDAVAVTRPGGTIVLAGLKGRGRGVDAFPADEVAMKFQTIKGVKAVDYHSFERAIRLIESGTVPVEALHTHHFALDRAADAVRALSSPTESAIAITIEPELA